jgi:hypothetical protein
MLPFYMAGGKLVGSQTDAVEEKPEGEATTEPS